MFLVFNEAEKKKVSKKKSRKLQSKHSYTEEEQGMRWRGERKEHQSLTVVEVFG